MKTYKFHCSNCNQSIESENAPMSTIECPTCKYTFAPAQIENVEAKEAKTLADVKDDLERLQESQKLAAILSDAEPAESSAEISSVAGWICLIIGIILGIYVAANSENAMFAWAVFGSFFSLWLMCCVTSRLARIHAAIIRLRSDTISAK